MAKPPLIYLFFFFFLLLSPSLCLTEHQIKGSDLSLDFSTNKKMTKISFKFQLSTALTSTDYLEIAFPFALHYLTTASPYTLSTKNLQIPLALQAKWFDVDFDTGDILDPNQNTQCRLYVKDLSSSVYYVQFLDTSFETVSISTTWYAIQFTISDIKAQDLQYDSEVLIVSMRSVSSPDPDYSITYQQNQVLTYFYLYSDPSSNIDFSVAYQNQNTQGDINAQNTVYFDADFSKLDESYFDDYVRIYIKILDPNFVFQEGSSCYSSTKYNHPTINSYTSLQYTCSILNGDTSTIQVLVEKTAFMKQKSLRVAAKVQNPKKIISGADVEIRLLRQVSPQILASKSVQNALYTTALSLSYHEIFFAWGLRDDPNLPVHLKLVRQDSSETLYKPFNSIKTVFKLAKNSPPNVELKVNVKINVDSEAQLLTSHISHNLPAATYKQVVCSEINRYSIQKREISCKGVGELNQSQEYYVAFKMTFPYDVLYEPISMEYLGAITISTGLGLDPQDSLFIFGRQSDYLQHLQSLDDTFLIREDSYIFANYMKQFSQIQILARAQDFQDYKEEVIMCQRPFDYSNTNDNNSQKEMYFDDVFMPVDVYSFLDYVQDQFKNKLYIFQRDIQNHMDYINGYDDEFLINLSIPTNMDKVETINGKNFLPNDDNYQPTIVSSVPVYEDFKDTFDPANPQKQIGLQKNEVAQRLMFSMNFGYEDLTKDGTLIENTSFQNFFQVGINIMTNYKIQPVDENYSDILQTPSSQHRSVDTKTKHVNEDEEYNKYTSIEITIENSDALQNLFPNSFNRTYNYFGVQAFKISEFSSQYVNENIYDFYIQMEDGIQGGDTNQNIISYALVNAYTIDLNAFQDIQISISNYWNKGTEAINGKYIPMLLKITGKFHDYDQPDEVEKIHVFFDNFDLFYSNKFGNEIFCSSYNSNQIMEQKCQGFSENAQQSGPQIQSYLNWNHITFEIEKTSDFFSVIFPIKSYASTDLINTINIQLATTQNDTLLNDNFKKIKLAGKKFIFTDLNLSVASSSNPFIINEKGNTDSSLNIGLDISILDPTVSNIETFFPTIDFNFKFVSTAIDDMINVNDYINQKTGSGLTYVMDYKFYLSSSSIVNSQADPIDNPCIFFHYIYDSYEAGILEFVIQKKYGFYCPNDLSIIPDTSLTQQLSIKEFITPVNSGLQLNGYLGYSQNDGNLYYLIRQTDNLLNPKQITHLTDITTFNLKKSVSYTILVIKFKIPYDLQDSLYVEISPQSPSTSFPFTNSNLNQCQLFKHNPVTWTDPTYNVEQESLYHTCSVNFDQTNNIIRYSVEQLRGKYEANDELELYHYGMHSLGTIATTYLKINFGKYNTFVPSDLSFFAENVELTEDTANPQQLLKVSDYKQDNLYKDSITSIQFKVELTSRPFWKNENIYINLGDFKTSNVNSADQVYCYILEQDETLSHNYATLDTDSLDQVYLQAKSYIFTHSLIFIFKCDFIKTPNTNTQLLLDLDVRPQITSIRVFQPSDIIYPTLPFFSDQTVTYSNQNYVEKQYVFPSSNFDLYFHFTPGFDLTSQSYIVLIFPIYYLPELSRNQVIECYLQSNENQGQRYDLQCSIIDNRSLQVQYFPETLVASKKFVFIVSGITQPIIQDTQYDFYYLVYDSAQKIQFQMNYIQDVIDDRASEVAISSIYLEKFSSSSNYLMDDGVYMDWYFKIENNAYNIDIGQKIIINFPMFHQSFLRQDQSLDCKVYDTIDGVVNYAGTCRVRSLKLIITIKETLEMGNTYRIRLQNMRNNDITNVELALWYFEVSDSNSQSIIQKSFPQTTNQQITHFTQSQSSKVLQLIDKNGNEVTQLNLIKGVCSDWIYLKKDSTQVSFGQSFNLKSYNDDIATYPSEIQVQVGTSHFKFRITSHNAIGDYSFLLKKAGGGDYYSNLSPLILFFDDNNLVPFEFETSTFSVHSKATTFSLLLTLKSNPPSSPLTIKFSHPGLTTSYGLVFKNQIDTIQLSVQKPYAYLYFVVDNQAIFQSNTNVPLNMAVSGLNVQSYSFASNQIFIQPQDLSAVPLNKPVLTQNTLATDLAYNNAEFQVTCSKNGRFYYALTILFQDDQDQCQRTQQQIIDKHSDDSVLFESDSDLYPCEDIYGLHNVVANTPITIYLEDLKSKKYYRLTGFCQDPQEKNSELSTVTFQTKFNEAYHAKLVFDFYAEKLTNTQLESLCCLLAINFKTSIQSVSTLDGIICDQYFSDAINENQDNEFAISLGLGEVNSLDCSESLIYLQDTSKVQSYTTTIYIGRDEFIGLNKIYENVETQSNCLYFKDYLQDNIATIPLILNVHPAEVIVDTAPALINQDEIILYTSYSWAHFNNIQLSGNGIIYVILVEGNSNMPTVTQLKNLVDYNSEEPLQSQKFLYDSQQVLQFNVTFTDLSSAKFYDIYFVISNELPFDYATFTGVYQYSFCTRFYSQVEAHVQIFQYLLLLILGIFFLL